MRFQERSDLLDLADRLSVVQSKCEALADDLARRRRRQLADAYVRDLDAKLDRLSAQVGERHLRDAIMLVFLQRRRGEDAASVERDLDLWLALASTRDRVTRRISAPDRALENDLTLARDLALRLAQARDNLVNAANDFTGADLTTVDLGRSDLAGIRWDDNTRWPSHTRTARIRRGSAEDPPGSGIFAIEPDVAADADPTS